jgi:hypothetical protein
VGMNFHMVAVKPTSDGGLVELQGPHTSARVRSNTLFDLLDRIEDRKRRGGFQPSLFPWYQKSFDYDSGRQPMASDCFRPKEVLSSLQAIERELQKNSSKYPYEAAFWMLMPDGTRSRLPDGDLYYRGKACRLFGDEKGVWAVETNTPLAFPVHYELTEVPEVKVQFDLGGPDVVVQIERRSCLAIHAPMFQDLKRVCLAALEADGLLLTSIG